MPMFIDSRMSKNATISEDLRNIGFLNKKER